MDAADNTAVPQQPAAPIAPPPPVNRDAQPPAAQNPPPPRRGNRQPRRDRLSASSATITSLPSMLELVAGQPFATIERRSTSTFVPSFIAASFIINAMNYHMSHTDRFLRGAPMWLPPMSHAYFGILFLVQTLRAAREVSLLSAFQMQFLEGFEKFYDLRSLMVAGPLVPVFQSLAAHSGPFEWIGDICPVLPNIMALGQPGAHIAGNNLFAILPNVPLYIDILQKVRATAADLTGAQQIFTFMDNIMQVNAAAGANVRHHMNSPGASFLVAYSIEQFNRARHALQFIEFPPRLNAAGNRNDTMNIYQFCRFADRNMVFYGWFQHISATMQRYSQFFTESVPLSAIPPAGIASGSILWQFQANARLANAYTFTAAAGNVAAHYLQHPLESLAVTGEHSDPAKEEVEEQTSAIALVATDMSVSTHPHPPLHANVVTGPVWNLPNMRHSGTIDIAMGVSAKIESRYHVDTRRT